MIVKNCRTCKYYQPNQEEGKEDARDSVVYEMSSSWCWHEISGGEIATDDMIIGGACGRDLKLWERKEFKSE